MCVYVSVITVQIHILRASLIAQLVKNPPVMQETPVRFLGWEDPLEKGVGYPLQYSWASLVAQLVKNLPSMQETWVRSPGEGNWRIPWTEEPGGPQSMGWQRVRHDWANNLVM